MAAPTTLELATQPRETGSTAARRTRRDGLVPCVLYGPGLEPKAFSVEPLAMRPLIYTNLMQTVDLQVDGETHRAILKDIQFHPVTEDVLHADFLALAEDRKVTLTVPMRFQGTPQGQLDGGRTQRVRTDVKVRCLPKDIPPFVEIDISELTIGDSIHIGELEEEGVEFLAQPQATVVTVVAPKGGLEAVAAAEAEEAAALLEEEGEPVAEEGEGEETPSPEA